ncbi:MAG: bifunctional isocitrate dehydrogenase kinase/phosphatase [Desulfobacterales bacterium]
MNHTDHFFAEYLLNAFDGYHQEFKDITRRAGMRFRQADWHGIREDAVERLELYSTIVEGIVAEIRGMLGDTNSEQSRRVWKNVKTEFVGLIRNRYDFPLAETFFNSVTRRVFSVMGVNPEIEFTVSDFKIPLIEEKPCPICTAYPGQYRSGGIEAVVENILARFSNELPFADLSADSRQAAGAVKKHLEQQGISEHNMSVEMADSVFYRHKGAYLVGRILAGKRVEPLVFCILNIEGKIFVDAVLLNTAEVSILFSFANAYFHVDVAVPEEMINFLKSIIPEKRVSEIYTAIGYYKHGKAELFRELTRSLEQTRDRFEVASGQEGMVMIVFTLPAINVVFKMIKERFGQPKKTTREYIRNRYQLVFKHDRAGRLVDAQEFDHLRFHRALFSEQLIREFEEKAPNTFIQSGNQIIIRHLYTERRLTPLDVYIRENPPGAVRDVMMDYGWAIKELAASNIFPGDLFFKNFGVTRRGRVVFYDYDELCLLTDCRFRKLPEPRDDDEIMSDESWFPVGENDVFPGEFRKFLLPPEHVRQEFEKVHGDLFGVDFWEDMQKKHESGKVIHILPYRSHRRLGRNMLEGSGVHYLNQA